MRGRFASKIILGILLICQLSVCFGKDKTDPNESSKYLDAVREFADNVLRLGKDTYGPKHTPLFVDGLNIHTHEPVKWISPKGDVFTATETEEWILSNFASQQTLLRTLDGLSTLTGDQKYREAAMQATKYAFEHLQAPNGLFYWGHEVAYDVLEDKVRGNGWHTLKLHYPYYKLMWAVDPNATKRFIEAFWSAHILDWSNLDMDRGRLIAKHYKNPWNHEYKPGPTFFKGKGIATITTGTSLMHAGATLYRHSGQDQPLIWSKRLARRYVNTRHPKTGIGATWYNSPWRQIQLGDDLKEHFLDPHVTFFPYRLPKNTYFYHPERADAHPWIAFLLIGEMLRDQGKEFTLWALEELTAWGKVAYRKEDNSFIPILTDGTSLEGHVFKEDTYFGPKGTSLRPYFADLPFFWAYTAAYRTTGDGFMWQMARDIGLKNNFGDIGESPKHKAKIKVDTSSSDVFGLIGFLELYNRTNKPELLQMARRIGDNIVQNHFFKGFFVPTKKHTYTRFDSFEPLALLHLYTAMESKRGFVPRIWPSSPLFIRPYRYKEKPIDRRIIYTLTESFEPSLSPQEAAAIGDIDLIRSLIKKGFDIDGREDAIFKTALHRAVIGGHKDVVGLLLSRGADASARDQDLFATPLHYAAEYGHKNIVELLLANGADINAKNNDGQTPVDIAVSRNHSDVVKLLIENGVDISLHTASRFGDLAIVKSLIGKGDDINAKDTSGQTPLHYAAEYGRKDIAELLIANGANVNAKDKDGNTPGHVALDENNRSILELLMAKGANFTSIHLSAYQGELDEVRSFIDKGVDVNAKSKSGQTPLHKAAIRGHRDVVELLIDNATNVNATDEVGYTPLYCAVWSWDTETAELLIEKGADVQAKDKWGWTPLHYAASRDNRGMAYLLIVRGADVNAKDNSGETVLSVAKEKGHTEIVELLRRHGAK